MSLSLLVGTTVDKSKSYISDCCLVTEFRFPPCILLCQNKGQIVDLFLLLLSMQILEKHFPTNMIIRESHLLKPFNFVFFGTLL